MLHAAEVWPISTDGNAEDALIVARNAVDRDRVCRGPVLEGRPGLPLLVKNQIIGANIELD